MVITATVFALALVAPAALADDAAYKDGVKLYEQVEMDGAIAKFNEALLSSVGLSDPERATLHAWVGVCHGQLGRKDEAMASFRNAVKLDPTVKLPTIAPPDVEAQLEAARTDAKAAAGAAGAGAAGAGAAGPGAAGAGAAGAGAAGAGAVGAGAVGAGATGAGAAGAEGKPDGTVPVDPAGPAPEAPASDGPPMISMVAGGTGAVLLLAGGATFAIGLDTALRQSKEAEFNDEARALVNMGYLEYAVGGALAGLGAVGLGAAVAFALE